MSTKPVLKSSQVPAPTPAQIREMALARPKPKLPPPRKAPKEAPQVADP